MPAPERCRALTGLGYEEPTPIQLAAIPPLLEGRDLVGQAATGTGKTAAFALPILQRILAGAGRDEPLALVLVPTRELAVQVCAAMRSYGHHMRARVLAVYGGEPIGRQLGPLRRGVDIVVATPGRALDHINRGTLKLSGLGIPPPAGTRYGPSPAARHRRQPTDCWCGKRPTWCRAGTRPPLSAACLTWNGRRPRSSSAAPGTRWTSSPSP